MQREEENEEQWDQTGEQDPSLEGCFQALKTSICRIFIMPLLGLDLEVCQSEVPYSPEVEKIMAWDRHV